MISFEGRGTPWSNGSVFATVSSSIDCTLRTTHIGNQHTITPGSYYRASIVGDCVRIPFINEVLLFKTDELKLTRRR